MPRVTAVTRTACPKSTALHRIPDGLSPLSLCSLTASPRPSLTPFDKPAGPTHEAPSARRTRGGASLQRNSRSPSPPPHVRMCPRPPRRMYRTADGLSDLSAYTWRSARLIEAAVHANAQAKHPAPRQTRTPRSRASRCAFCAVTPLQNPLVPTTLATTPAALCALEDRARRGRSSARTTRQGSCAGYAERTSGRFLAHVPRACSTRRLPTVLLSCAARLAAGYPPVARAQQAWPDGFWGALLPVGSGSDTTLRDPPSARALCIACLATLRTRTVLASKSGRPLTLFRGGFAEYQFDNLKLKLAR
ncbi:hypothetical protein B0H15DRAFT_957246 [Mycena belliarum]|uniref:Uncharacterized protein n=1 Tax=Mycena belliarum TaxID=1033014 RepID=A0AAD6TRF1_9AGAR|nr:hypothetical protein B0H15DRAFT_957246 [Mycena belliae]